MELESKWKTGPITVGMMDNLPMKGISLLLGNDAGVRVMFSMKRTELNAMNGRNEMTIRVEKGYNLQNKSRGDEMADEDCEILRIGKSREELIRVQRNDSTHGKLYKQVERENGDNSWISISCRKEYWWENGNLRKLL